MSRAYASSSPGLEPSPFSGIRKRALYPARPISLVVVESGSCWPEGAELAANTADCDCILIAQQSDESPTLVADRVVRRLCSIREMGAVIEKATFATGPGMAAERCSARNRVARALLASSTMQAGGSIDFVAHRSMSEDSKRELLALAGTLLEQVGLEGPAIRVKLDGEIRELPSGVRRTVPVPWSADDALVAC